MKVRRPPLRYHGGKWLLAPWIIQHFPAHRVYVEPFGGGASVLLRKPRSYGEVYNDLDGAVVNVFRVLRDPEQAARFRHAIELTPFSREEFEATLGRRRGEEAPAVPEDPIEWARQTVVRSLQGFGSDAITRGYRTGFRARADKQGSHPAEDWARYPNNVPAWVERLRGVVIERRDAFELIEAMDGSEVLFYVDPPYVHATRGHVGKHGYRYELEDADHVRLAELLRGVRGRVVVSGYPSDLYRNAFDGWECVTRETFADGANARTECLWIKPGPASDRQRALVMESTA